MGHTASPGQFVGATLTPEQGLSPSHFLCVSQKGRALGTPRLGLSRLAPLTTQTTSQCQTWPQKLVGRASPRHLGIPRLSWGTRQGDWPTDEEGPHLQASTSALPSPNLHSHCRDGRKDPWTECAQSNGAGAALCPTAFRREPEASQSSKPSERAHQVVRLVRVGEGLGRPHP